MLVKRASKLPYFCAKTALNNSLIRCKIVLQSFGPIQTTQKLAKELQTFVNAIVNEMRISA